MQQVKIRHARDDILTSGFAWPGVVGPEDNNSWSEYDNEGWTLRLNSSGLSSDTWGSRTARLSGPSTLPSTTACLPSWVSRTRPPWLALVCNDKGGILMDPEQDSKYISLRERELSGSKECSWGGLPGTEYCTPCPGPRSQFSILFGHFHAWCLTPLFRVFLQ